MKSNFEQSLKLVLVHEGGFANHPRDPGGRTMRGVTQRTYDAYRASKGKGTVDVIGISEEELRDIYRSQYWHKVEADDLPMGLDYAVFDFAVNSGPSRAAKFLQRIVGVAEDGVIGAQTIAAVRQRDATTVIDRLCSDRLSWLRRLKTFDAFGKGWTRRVNSVREDATDMARDAPPVTRVARVEDPPSAKTGNRERMTDTGQVAENGGSLTAGGAVTALLGVSTQTEGLVQLALVLGVLAVVGFVLWRSWKSEA